MADIVFLHFLGGSAGTWRAVIERLPGTRAIPLDLPGFGDAAGRGACTVAEMADAVSAAIVAHGIESFTLVGHSMGAKVATVLARRAADGDAALAGLRGLVLVAGSPPAPEPMDDGKRREMLRWFAADPATSARQAHDFVQANVTADLPQARHDAAVADVLRTSPNAWRAWFDHGSREDWRDRIGILTIPTLIVSGADDPFLGPEGQRRHTVPHFAQVRHVTLDDTKHLIPLERPDALARLIGEHIA